jgi:hypothetical protein
MCCGRPFAKLTSCAPSVPIRRAAAALAADAKSHVMTVAASSLPSDHHDRVKPSRQRRAPDFKNPGKASPLLFHCDALAATSLH